MYFLYSFGIVLSFCNSLFCQLYCSVPALNPGLFIYNDRRGKDDPYVGAESTYTLFSEKFTLIKRNQVLQSWNETTSLTTNLINEPVLDQRWESFLNNHDNEIAIQRILKKRRDDIFLSVRFSNISQWSHVKSNNSGIYACHISNHCDDHIDNDTIFHYYTKHYTQKNVWKLHNYSYFHTKKEIQGEVIYENDKNCSTVLEKACLLMYFAMCKDCNLLLSVNNTNFTIQGNGSWISKYCCIQNFSNCFSLSIHTNTSSSTENPFWAISSKGYIVKDSNNMRYRKAIDNNSLVCEDAWNRKYNFSNEIKTINPERTSDITRNYLWSTSSKFVILWTSIFVAVLTLLLVSYCRFRKRSKSLTKCKEDVEQLISHTNSCKPNIYSGIKILEFGEYVKNLDCQLSKQFSQLPIGQLKPCLEGKRKKNIEKNYFTDIFPYDENRVKLKNCSSDYINASYIQGFSNYREYIISQNPLQHTISDFWVMIWQQTISDIVMVTKKNESYNQYWPELNRVCTYAGMEIHVEEVQQCKNYIQRKLLIKNQNLIREVTQLHFNQFSDDDLTTLPKLILPFIERLLHIPHYFSPVLFHSLGGVGPSGTLLLCDMVLRALPVTETVDLYHFATLLRQSRFGTMSTLNEYKLAHLIINSHLSKDKR